MPLVLVQDPDQLNEPRVGNLGEDSFVTPPGEFVASDQADGSCERVRISGSFFMSTPARAKKAFKS